MMRVVEGDESWATLKTPWKTALSAVYSTASVSTHGCVEPASVKRAS